MTWPLAIILAVSIIAIAWVVVVLIGVRAFRKTARDMDRSFNDRWRR